MKQTHYLKTVQPYFNEVYDLKKKFELRKNDRNFQVGDEVCLCEYGSNKQEGIERRIRATIIYVISDYAGLQEGYCIFGFKINQFIQHVIDDLISVEHLMNLHKELTNVEAESLLKYCKEHSIQYKACYGDGSIMFPKWKEVQARLQSIEKFRQQFKRICNWCRQEKLSDDGYSLNESNFICNECNLIHDIV